MYCPLLFSAFVLNYKKKDVLPLLMIAGLKDAERHGRYVISSPNIVLDEKTPVIVQQGPFLANSTNKAAFIQLLNEKLVK